MSRRNRQSVRVSGFPDQLADRRQSPPARSGELTPRWSGNATRRAVPTDKGRLTIIAGAVRTRRANHGGDTQPIAPEATLKLSRSCKARRGVSNTYPAEVGNPLLQRSALCISLQIERREISTLYFSRISGLTRVITCWITWKPFPREFRRFAISKFFINNVRIVTSGEKNRTCKS